ncbi:thialysine N-epsilon-acetyltransferase-like [Pyxicephalus adspersus]|uniref:thialysine N-epsilon-acetyltransferase-like n=1 Tax=Pyxicephalus adspersus TaxID=30357 RepID=UPI003B5AC73F
MESDKRLLSGLIMVILRGQAGAGVHRSRGGEGVIISDIKGFISVSDIVLQIHCGSSEAVPCPVIGQCWERACPDHSFYQQFSVLLSQELAEYEKISNYITLTEEALFQDGFGESAWFRCVVAELLEGERSESGLPLAGYALFANSYSSWTGRTLHLEDLYVSPQFRGRGIGKMLMRKVAQLCLSLGCARLQLSVLDWNHKAIAFYQSRGGRNLSEEEGWYLFRFLPDDLRQMISKDRAGNPTPS